MIICKHFKLWIFILLLIKLSLIHRVKCCCSFKCEESDLNIHVDFKSERIQNEFIVEFMSFYWPQTRVKFLQSALQKANIFQWEIVARLNPASVYPSNFDVLHLYDDENIALNVTTLVTHPAIKRVSSHKRLQRHLKYTTYNDTLENESPYNGIGRHLLRAVPQSIASALQANQLWELGITGKGVKVAIFDTGLARNHPHFRRIKERTNWTNEKTLDDGVSHGTFVAGVIASAKECLGLAPDAELHIYRVFTNSQVSYTSWFLDAFNYAIFKKVNILNLSIGGPDFLDRPFVDKVLELSANKIIMVSAIGNDGPLYGTLNNPGDQSDVIGVGGISFDERVAKFSSRGMTTWELPGGYGRLKPDIVTYGSQVRGSDIHSGCRSLSGTSVASPVVAGAIALITSGALQKLEQINPSSMKQILIEGASRVADNNMFEQGHGKLSVIKSMKLLSSYVPKVTLSPAYLDLTESYMWPYSSQPLFCGAMPLIVNVTILNGIAVTSKILEQPIWQYVENKRGDLLNVAVSFSPVIWPWSGWMSLHISVNMDACEFEGVIQGQISLIVQSQILHSNQKKIVNNTVNFPIAIKIIPRPPRNKRILWDQYHSLRYPPGYVPRDNLKIKSDPLDWRADHLHTNFRDAYIHLRNAGYYIDILGMPYTCFNASEYGTLLIVDPEEEFFDEEILKIENDVYERGLSIIVFADWYNTTVMKKIKFFDENTRQWWIPDTGGSNIPALNDFLQPYGIALGDFVGEGYFALGDHDMYFASGSSIAKFPQHHENIVIGADLHDQGMEIIKNINSATKTKRYAPILGLCQTKKSLRKKSLLLENMDIALSKYEENTIDESDMVSDIAIEKNPMINKRILLQFDSKSIITNYQDISEKRIDSEMHRDEYFHVEGRIALFGDSNCLDSIHLKKPCFWLLDALLDYTMNSYKSVLLKKLDKTSEFNFDSNKNLPLRIVNSNLYQYSKVLYFDSVDNKIKKRALEKCKTLHWSKAKIISGVDANFSFRNVMDEDLYKSANEGYYGANVIDLTDDQYILKRNSIKYGAVGEENSNFERYIKISLIYLIIISCIVLIAFIILLKRIKQFKTTKLKSVSSRI